MVSDVVLSHLSFDDVEDLLRWTYGLSEDERSEARRMALEVVTARGAVGSPVVVRQIKALTVVLAGDLQAVGMAHANAIVAGLIEVVETTHHPEIQFRCGTALATFLLRSAVDEDFFVRGVVLLRALAEVSTFPEARAYFRSILGPDAPFGQKLEARERASLPDDHLPLWFTTEGQRARYVAERAGWTTRGQIRRLTDEEILAETRRQSPTGRERKKDLRSIREAAKDRLQGVMDDPQP